jgi:hypothetical protein
LNIAQIAIDCPPDSPGALRPSATQWGEVVAEASGAQVTTAGAEPDGWAGKMAHFAMEKMGENIVFSMVILTIWL